jgi:hypothetical protein
MLPTTEAHERADPWNLLAESLQNASSGGQLPTLQQSSKPAFPAITMTAADTQICSTLSKLKLLTPILQVH